MSDMFTMIGMLRRMFDFLPAAFLEY